MKTIKPVKTEVSVQVHAVVDMSGSATRTVVLTREMASLSKNQKEEIHLLTTEVWGSQQAIANHQAFICLNLYKLKTAIGDNWRPFAKANFEALAMSVRTFDRKIKLGELLFDTINRTGGNEVQATLAKFTGAGLEELFMLDEKGVDMVLSKLDSSLAHITSGNVKSTSAEITTSINDQINELQVRLDKERRSNEQLTADMNFLSKKSENMQTEMLHLQTSNDTVLAENSRLKSATPIQIIEAPKGQHNIKSLSKDKPSIVDSASIKEIETKIESLRAEVFHLTGQKDSLTRVVDDAKQSEALLLDLTNSFNTLVAKFPPEMLKVMAKSNARTGGQFIHFSKMAIQFGQHLQNASAFVMETE